MALTVKAYMKRGENVNKEIRRFSVDPEVAANYEYMSRKVAQVFPSLGNPDNFSLAWKDCDEDLITFSSDEELVEALGQKDGDVFRIYVRVLPGRAGNTDTDGSKKFREEDIFHPGVVCDGCELPIRGPRFKCIECPDFDLCKDCEEKGLHEEHQFVKFRRPQIGRSRCGGFGFRPGMWRTFGHPGWRHWWWQQQQHQHQQQQQQQGCGQENPQAAEGASENPNGSEQAGPTPGGGQGAFNPSTFLHDIGQSVAQMLDPLGIDVDIDVEHNGQRRNCGGGGGRGARFHCYGQPDGQGRGHGKFKKGCKGKWKDHQFAEQEQAEEAMQKEAAAAGAAAGAAGAAAAARAAAAADAGAGPSGSQKEAKAAETMETDSANGEQCDETGWTLLVESSSSQSDPTAPPMTQQEPVQTGAQGADKAVQLEADKLKDLHIGNHPDPRISSALSYMKAMGYDDDGGWLTHLLEAKGGDINRALDTIKFGQHPQAPK